MTEQLKRDLQAAAEYIDRFYGGDLEPTKEVKDTLIKFAKKYHQEMLHRRV